MTNDPALLFKFATELLNAGENEQALETVERVERLSQASGGWERADEINVRLNQALCHLRYRGMNLDSTVRFERTRTFSVWFAARCLRPLGYLEMSGTGPRDRTANLRLWRPPFCQLS